MALKTTTQKWPFWEYSLEKHVSLCLQNQQAPQHNFFSLPKIVGMELETSRDIIKTIKLWIRRLQSRAPSLSDFYPTFEFCTIPNCQTAFRLTLLSQDWSRWFLKKTGLSMSNQTFFLNTSSGAERQWRSVKHILLDNYQLLSTIRRELLAGQALVMRGTRTRRDTIGLFGPRTASPIGQFWSLLDTLFKSMAQMTLGLHHLLVGFDLS